MQANRATAGSFQATRNGNPGAKRPTKFYSDAKQFASERTGDIDAAVKRMNADAVEAEKKLQKLNRAGNELWSALVAALTETRPVFDRLNEVTREAFKRAA